MSLFSRRVDKQLEAYQRELVDTHYKEVENMYRQIRGWRHDYRNHIQVLKAFAAKGDMDAIRASGLELTDDYFEAWYQATLAQLQQYEG